MGFLKFKGFQDTYHPASNKGFIIPIRNSENLSQKPLEALNLQGGVD